LAIISPTTVWFVAKFYITFSLTILGNESSRDGTFQGEKVLRSEKARYQFQYSLQVHQLAGNAHD